MWVLGRIDCTIYPAKIAPNLTVRKIAILTTQRLITKYYLRGRTPLKSPESNPNLTLTPNLTP